MKNEPNKNIAELFAALSKTFAEAVVCSKPSLFESTNAFGREVRLYEVNQIASLIGEAMSGIRVSAMVHSSDLEGIAKSLTAFYKQKLPLTLVVYGNAYKYINTLKGCGFVVLKANSAKTLQETMLIGQVVAEKSLNPVAILADFENVETILFYKNDDLIAWFGNPDDRSLSPTPEQQMVLGVERKRMPAWLHRDYPALWNADKNRVT